MINFGQIGDITLSLPALNIIRKKYENANISALIGTTANSVMEMSELFDEIITVDRVELRDSNKLWSIKQIINIVADIRRRKFDFVIDMHSLYESNLLGYLSGARQRLFANRGNRSLDFLSNFRPKPPINDHSVLIADYYLGIVKPLGFDEEFSFKLRPKESDVEMFRALLKTDKIDGKHLIGLNIGAGNPSRHWSIDNFAELARSFSNFENTAVLAFYGPEEQHLRAEIVEKFPEDVVIYDQLTIPQLAAAFSCLKVLIGSDTGPTQLGASIGTSVVFLTDPMTFRPPGGHIHVAGFGLPDDLKVDEVFEIARKLL